MKLSDVLKSPITYGILAVIFLFLWINSCNKPTPALDTRLADSLQRDLIKQADSLKKDADLQNKILEREAKTRDSLNNVIDELYSFISRNQLQLNKKFHEIDNQKFDREFIDAYLRSLDSSADSRQHGNDNIHY